MLRIQFELSDERVKDLDALMKKGDVSTKKELLNNALTFLEWAIKEKERGRIIASIDEEHQKYKEIDMPIFSAVSKKSTVHVNRSAIAR